jgi:hypothetical protein
MKFRFPWLLTPSLAALALTEHLPHTDLFAEDLPRKRPPPKNGAGLCRLLRVVERAATGATAQAEACTAIEEAIFDC